MKSQNSIIVTGRLTSDAKELSNNAGVAFSIAHSMGKDRKPLYLDFTYFVKNGKFTNNIPREILKKGQAVTVSAFMKPDSYTKADGTVVNTIQMVVKQVEKFIPDNDTEPTEEKAE